MKHARALVTVLLMVPMHASHAGEDGPGGYAMIASSDDDGETWQGSLLLDKRHCSYPDGIQSPDGRIHVVYDQERHNGRILMASVREDDVRAGKLVSKDAALKTLVYAAASMSR
jgi:hypothetical protein